MYECGRAGCNGSDSICILLHNGLLSSQCSADMRECIGETNVDDSNCWSNSPVKVDAKCCDICASKCDCSGIVGDCGSKFLLTFDKEESNYTFTKSKGVSRQQKELLKSKLLEYITKLRHNCKNHVLFPNVHLEFSMFHISQVLENCANLYKVDMKISNGKILTLLCSTI